MNLYPAFLLAASLAFAQDADRWFLPPARDRVAPQTSAAIMKSLCLGKVTGESCSQCPGSDEGPWTFSALVVGHFRAPASDDAFAGAASCHYPGRAWPIALRLGKQNGAWTEIDTLLAFDPGKCIRRKLRDGRDFLICESYDYQRDGERVYGLSALSIQDGQPRFDTLFNASDTIRTCREGLAHQALVQKIELRDLNGDGLEDISLTATYGTLQIAGRIQEQCEAAEEDRLQSRKPAKPFPRPAAVKTYRIDLLFDGERYTPTQSSRAAAELFHVDRE
jgi:hypothetical protein